MKRNNNKNVNMKGKTLIVAAEDDELFSQTDSANSSTSSNEQLPVRNQTLVMDLHEMKRDELPDNPLPEVKTRKLLKKKRPKATQDRPDQSAGSLTSSSEGSVVPPGPEKQEEFFDAHESYYDFPENQKSGSAITALTITSKQLSEVSPATPENLAKPEIPAITDATTGPVSPVTQDTATGPTPLTSANPIRSRTPI